MKLIAIYILLFFTAFSSCTRDMERELLKKALLFEVNGQYENALQSLRELSLGAKRIELSAIADYEMGRIYEFYYKEYRMALICYGSVLSKVLDSEQRTKSQERIADIYFLYYKDYHQAIAEYNKFIEISHDITAKHLAHYKIGKCYSLLNNFDQARLEYKELLKKCPEGSLKQNIYIEIAKTYFFEGRIEDAIELYKFIINKYPFHPKINDLKLDLARCMDEKGEIKCALDLYNGLKTIYPNRKVIETRIKNIKLRIAKGS